MAGRGFIRIFKLVYAAFPHSTHSVILRTENVDGSRVKIMCPGRATGLGLILTLSTSMSKSTIPRVRLVHVPLIDNWFFQWLLKSSKWPLSPVSCFFNQVGIDAQVQSVASRQVQ